MKCFIAGGTGVIGRRAVPALLADGHEVTAVARSTERAEALRSLGAVPVAVDLFDAAAVSAAIEGHDAVINLATHIPPLSRASRSKAWAENDRLRIDAAGNMAAAAVAHGLDRFVQESITFPYADGGSEWIHEDAPRPPSPYTTATDAAEAGAASVSAAGGVGVVLRFAQFHAPDSSHTRAFTRAFRMGINPVIGPADGYTSTIGMDAAARAVVAALRAPGGIYNIADADPPTRRAIAEAWAAATGRRRPARSLPTGLMARMNPSADVLMRSHRISCTAFTDATGWKPDDHGADGLVASMLAVRGGAGR